MRNWSEIYQKKIEALGGPKKYLSSKVKEKSLLLKKISYYAGPNGKILEAGCGTGVLSTFLSNQGFTVTAVDIDEDMLNIAKKISENFLDHPIFKKMDLFNLEFNNHSFDLVFSHGVLEHFKDNEITALLKKQLEIAKIVIFSVPSNYLTKKDRFFGNERFLSEEKWKKLIEKADAFIMETFGFHYLIGWRGYWDCLIRRKIFGPSPYLAFVLRKK